LRAELEAALDHADAARAVANPPDVEPVLRVGEAAAFLADAIFDRHLDVLEGDLPGRSSTTSSWARNSFTPGAFMSTMNAEMPPCEPFERSVAAISCV
jgi:hypothetical protein